MADAYNESLPSNSCFCDLLIWYRNVQFRLPPIRTGAQSGTDYHPWSHDLHFCGSDVPKWKDLLLGETGVESSAKEAASLLTAGLQRNFHRSLGYTGQYMDPETGLIYLRARYYDPATAQFLTRDPLDALTRSDYGYVDGNPLNSTDPSGLFCIFSNSKGCIGLGKIVSDATSTVYQHTNINLGACVIACVDIGFQGGHFYDQTGAWGLAAPGLTINGTTRSFDCQQHDSFQGGGGFDLGGDFSIGQKPNGATDWGDIQGGLVIKPGGIWIGHFSTHEIH